MQREFSAGGIVLKKNKQNLEVLLVQNHKISRPDEFWWGFPKGHPEDGESSKEAATREVKEETGVEAEVLKKIGESKYIVTRDNEKYFKIVVMFLMKYLSGELEAQIVEVNQVEWVEVTKAAGKLTFSNDKKLLDKALEVYQKE